ncbi:hypothetical protein BDQ94DRAFT_155930 [Aspergillus welwitschiae]|uniref:Uncharacterized protein n=1 Tax=Aspergillus welwitschiae TaxID=1341132 RepID=A0A3F3PGW9_9EURO|nr:hypothetical protein BDQ94DRAFT_155930 [Aspergillus welwitschiae]RDH26165.1 hypothetical protein BDQ94DRAFT_155930 [Aspergillus welwitschiae]
MTEIFRLEHTVPASMLPPLPSVHHDYRFWSARLPRYIERFSTPTWRFDPFVLALSIHRVIRKVMSILRSLASAVFPRPQIAHSHKICVDASKLGNMRESNKKGNSLQGLYP